MKRNCPDSQPVGQEKKSCRTRKIASEKLIVIHSDTEDESIAAEVTEEVASSRTQWIDLTNWMSDDVSIIEEKRGNGLTSPLQLGVSTGLAGQGEQEAQKQVRQDRSSERRQPKTTIAMVDLTMTEQSARVETNRADPVTNTSEVVDLTKVDLTTSEVDLDINAPLNNTLLCPVCLDPLF